MKSPYKRVLPLPVTIIYMLLGLSFIIADNINLAITGFVIKSLLMPVLIIYTWFSWPRADRKNLYILTGALFFSWAGDVLLEYQWSESSLFVPGLLCFLTAHVFYIVLFISRLKPARLTSLGLLLTYAFIVVFGLLLVFYLYKDLGEMKVPVMIYATVILSMLAAGFTRDKSFGSRGSRLVLAGAILFVISDTILAVNRFGHSFSMAGALIMVTYLSAQYLIVRGVIEDEIK